MLKKLAFKVQKKMSKFLFCSCNNIPRTSKKMNSSLSNRHADIVSTTSSVVADDKVATILPPQEQLPTLSAALYKDDLLPSSLSNSTPNLLDVSSINDQQSFGKLMRGEIWFDPIFCSYFAVHLVEIADKVANEELATFLREEEFDGSDEEEENLEFSSPSNSSKTSPSDVSSSNDQQSYGGKLTQGELLPDSIFCSYFAVRLVEIADKVANEELTTFPREEEFGGDEEEVNFEISPPFSNSTTVQIQPPPIFPIFNQDLLYGDHSSKPNNKVSSKELFYEDDDKSSEAKKNVLEATMKMQLPCLTMETGLNKEQTRLPPTAKNVGKRERRPTDFSSLHEFLQFWNKRASKVRRRMSKLLLCRSSSFSPTSSSSVNPEVSSLSGWFSGIRSTTTDSTVAEDNISATFTPPTGPASRPAFHIHELLPSSLSSSNNNQSDNSTSSSGQQLDGEPVLRDIWYAPSFSSYLVAEKVADEELTKLKREEYFGDHEEEDIFEFSSPLSVFAASGTTSLIQPPATFPIFNQDLLLGHHFSRPTKKVSLRELFAKERDDDVVMANHF